VPSKRSATQGYTTLELIDLLGILRSSLAPIAVME
jgi:hypothetical protein